MNRIRFEVFVADASDEGSSQVSHQKAAHSSQDRFALKIASHSGNLHVQERHSHEGTSRFSPPMRAAFCRTHARGGLLAQRQLFPGRTR